MAGPSAAVAAARVAVRRWLEEAGPAPGDLALVGCSGGADSLALVAATAFVAPRLGLRAGAVVVDHGLQPGSDRVARRAAEQCRGLLDSDNGGGPVEVVPVTVADDGTGPESAARQVRYAALRATAQRLGARAVLLGHTRDDQAETVLLGLARGAGTRSAAGMAPTRVLTGTTGRPDRHSETLGAGERGEGEGPGAWGREVVLLGRPFLGLPRAGTRQVCVDLGLRPWDDPHNEDPRFARVRARQALAGLEDVLGPGLVGNLARTADLLREDADALDAVAGQAYLELGEPPWEVGAVGALARAVRTRLWRRLALAAGSPGTDLTGEHLHAVDDLVARWHGQGPLHLPGGVRAGRDGDRVWLRGQT
ncbi:ATP-binding protein [Ornithinimicrobium sp. LYQ92]|uniref:tRNA lysidine(34) synthetase n=1 Tax=Serinicoccus sp. LYQ92 TaxID=3378798 RepID=UPI0038536140